MPSAQRDLRTSVLTAMLTTISSAKDMIMRGEGPVDAEFEYGRNQPYEYYLDLLERLLGSDRDHARPPISAERVTFGVMRHALQEKFPDCYVVGDKAVEDELTTAAAARPGALIFSVDAIDGSLPYEVLTFGYGTSVVAYTRTDTGVQLLLCAVANSSHLAATFEAPGSVWMGDLSGQERELNSWTRRDAIENTVAVLAAEPRYRSRVDRLMSDPSLVVFTTGGAPASLGLLLGGLEALVSIEAQTVHDAAYLPIFAHQGYTILTREGPLGPIDVRCLFESVSDDWRTKPIPPFIATRREESARYLEQLVFTHSSR
jgi:hypothetical protein